jgi:hypothetical protein
VQWDTEVFRFVDWIRSYIERNPPAAPTGSGYPSDALEALDNPD